MSRWKKTSPTSPTCPGISGHDVNNWTCPVHTPTAQLAVSVNTTELTTFDTSVAPRAMEIKSVNANANNVVVVDQHGNSHTFPNFESVTITAT